MRVGSNRQMERDLAKLGQHKPEPRWGLEIFHESFEILSGERHIGMGSIGPIPIMAIIQWAVVRYGYDPRGFEILDFVRMIRAMDSAFVVARNEVMQAEREQAAAAAKAAEDAKDL